MSSLCLLAWLSYKSSIHPYERTRRMTHIRISRIAWPGSSTWRTCTLPRTSFEQSIGSEQGTVLGPRRHGERCYLLHVRRCQAFPRRTVCNLSTLYCSITVGASDISIDLLMSQARLLLIMFVGFETLRTWKLMIDRIPCSLGRRGICPIFLGLAPPVDAQVCAPHHR